MRDFFLLILVLALLLLAACGRAAPTARQVGSATNAPTPTVGVTEARPDTVAATIAMRPDVGGVVGLSDGAEVSLPEDALSDSAVVTLSALDHPPRVPIPRSIIGRAYQFAVEGGSLTGIALLKLPIPVEVASDEYDLAAYRWTGQTWDRVGGRLAGNSFQIGTNTPGTFALLGRWKSADAALALLIPPTSSGEAATMAVAGQYRFASLPVMQHDFVPATLRLKRDTSGGAGQVRGEEDLDQTIAEAVLWFKPDPAQSQGVIEFSYVFGVTPAELGMSPGSSSRFYAVLTVDDGVAPTRQLSTGIEYTLIIPIQVVGTDVVRPSLGQDEPSLSPSRSLRWSVLLNDRPFRQLPAIDTRLPLTDLLAQGGLGDYRITLESDLEGRSTTVSNEVTIKLALPATATPTPAPSPTRGLAATATSSAATGAITPSMPPTPTRRSTPSERTSEPTPGRSPTPTPVSSTVTPTRPAWARLFWADHYTLASGECTTLHWNLENVISVYLDGNPVTGSEDRQVCPTQTTVYTLRVTDSAGSQDRSVTIAVGTATEAAIEFTADAYQISVGSCTALHWRVTDVREVYLDDEGVAGEESREVCPDMTTEYTLRVVTNAGVSDTVSLTISVLEADEIVLRFWAERYSLGPDQCTTLHWSVQDVEAVYLEAEGPEEGVTGEGTRSVCPLGAGQTYVLTAIASEGVSAVKELTLDVISRTLSGGELIAQGIVNSVNAVTDIDSSTPGDQPGWRLLVDGINPLFAPPGARIPAVVTLQVDADQVEDVEQGPVDWPINPGQYVEFHAICSDSTCTLPSSAGFYLRLRSN